MNTLKVGDKMPDFKGTDEQNKEVSSADFQGKKLIVFFYPADNTPGCTAEACSLRDNYDALQDKGFELIGVSPDTAKKHQNFISKYSFPFRLLADTEHQIMDAFGVWGPKKFMGKTFDGVHRTTFLIDETGTIVKVFDKVDTKNHAQQILEFEN
jgi:peroxiredoxin Q/BCP